MALTDHRITASEYFADPPAERHTELIDGVVIVNEPRLPHERIAGLICYRLTLWTNEAQGRGEAGRPVDVHLDQRNVFAPDVWWVPEEDRPSRDALRIEGPPALAVEVRSPSTWRYDVGTKKRVYEINGLRELWLVDDRAESILVFRRSSADTAGFDVDLELERGDDLVSPLLPEFSMRVSEIFDR